MTYDVLILKRAQKELAQLPHADYECARDAIAALGLEPRPQGSRKLTGRDGWRIRIGDYRVICEIDDDIHSVTVMHVGHRRDVYR